MARLIPPTIHSSVRSGAERRLFRTLERAPGTDEWICLHSLALARHESKRRGEIDFLLITPLGIFVLEVKGGRIRREAGSWVFTNRFGESNRRSESPFDQAAGAMFALERRIRDGLGAAWADLLFGYGVVFMDVEFQSVGAEADPDLVYDARDRHRPFEKWIERLARYTRAAQPRTRRAPTRKEIEDVATFLRGDFDLEPSLATVAEDTKAEQDALTREQQEVLDALAEEPRLLVDGPAGSGKTILALEAARRDARDGRRVLLLCFNRLLAARARAILREDFAGPLVVSTVHSWFRSIIEASSLREEFHARASGMSEREVYEVLFPEYAAMAALEQAGPPVDTLIVDEAQDVLTEGYTAALGEAVRDGLEGGRWRFFLDANNQASIYGRFDLALMKRLRGLGAVALLTKNCRNTRPIALQTNIVAEPRRYADGRVEGAPVQFLSYADQRACLGKLERVIADLRHEGIGSASVTVLLPKQPDDTTVARLERLGIRRLAEPDMAQGATPGFTTWSLVSGFKGLENDVVVLVGIENIVDPWWRGVTYVGMSRARVRLYVLLHADCDEVRCERLRAETERRLSKEMA